MYVCFTLFVSMFLFIFYPGTCLQVLQQTLLWILWTYISWTTLLHGTMSAKCVLLSLPDVAYGSWLCWLAAGNHVWPVGILAL